MGEGGEGGEGDEAKDFQPKKGDYQIQVHIYEARDLAPRDASGMSDPLVEVVCMGKKERTDKRKQTLSALWDRVLFFQFKDLEPEDVESAVVEMSVMDANAIMCNTLIGSFEVDLPTVYRKPKHRLKGWAGLIDTESENNKGVQGYLKFAVTVLGPGDEPPGEDDEKDKEKDKGQELDKATVLMPPRLEQEEWIVCVQLFEAQDLPRMDRFGEAGIDAFVSFQTRRSESVNSSIVKNRSPVFNQEIHVPFTVPGMSKFLDVRVLDYDLASGNDLIACHRIEIAKLKEQKDEKDLEPPEDCVPFWINLYGGPKEVSKRNTKVFDKMNQGLLEGTAYNGRVLMKVWKKKVHDAKREYVPLPRRSEDPNPDRKKEAKQKKKHMVDLYAFDLDNNEYRNEKRKNLKRLPMVQFPDLSDYQLRFTVFDAVEVPFEADMSIEVSWGAHSHSTSAKRVKGGAVHWDAKAETHSIEAAWPNLKQERAKYNNMTTNELRQELRREVPGRFSEERLATLSDSRLRSELNQLFVSTSMVPDVFVYLKKGDNRVAYCRLPARRLLSNTMLQPKWLMLKEDRALDLVPPGEMPGSVLVRARMYRRSGYHSDSANLEPPPEFNKRVNDDFFAFEFDQGRRVKYELRCHLYQASELPAADSNGSLDPYIQVGLGGVRARSSVIEQTTSPLYYETIFLRDVELPADISMAPNISVVIYDQDKFSKDDIVGRIQVPIARLFDYTSYEGHGTYESKCKEEATDPEWYTKVFLENPEVYDVGGKVMMAWQLVPMEEAAKYSADHVWPELLDATIELNVVGLRGLLPSPFPVNAAYIQFDCGNKKFLVQTKPSKNPSGTNPNHLEVYKLKAMLPEEPFFAPDLNIRVFDMRSRGLISFMISSGSLRLAPLFPWNEDEYALSLARAGVDINSRRPGEESDVDNDNNEGEGEGEGEDDDGDVEAGERGGGGEGGEGEGGGGGESRPLLSAQGGEAEGVELGRRSRIRVSSQKVGYGQLKDDAPPSESDSDSESSLSGNDEKEAKKKEKRAQKDVDEWMRPWMLDREHIDDELEDTFSTTPFHDVQLFTGQGDKRKEAGKLKAYFQVIPENMPDSEEAYKPPALPWKLTELMKPRPYLVRVYILTVSSLMPKDRGGTCDPYVHIRAGIRAKPIADRSNRKLQVQSSTYLYMSYEIPVTLPGPMLEVSLYDWNRIGLDELIGTTKIDLSNRWFNKEWKRIKNKPIEQRCLYHPSVTTPQGKLKMWVDIMERKQAKNIPAFNISPPPPQNFELRVIVWTTKKLPSMEMVSGLNDMFIRVVLESPRKVETKETDTHWRSKKGIGNFNYRMKFPIVYDPAQPPSYRLKISAWDRDIVKNNDCIGEIAMDLERQWLEEAYNRWRQANGESGPVMGGDDKVVAEKAQGEGADGNAMGGAEPLYLWGDEREAKKQQYTIPNKWVSLGPDKGFILMSVELIHEADARAKECGEGREMPNQHPFLHEPVRPKFDLFSPLSNLEILVGPELFNRFKCIIVCAYTVFCLWIAFICMSYVRIWF